MIQSYPWYIADWRESETRLSLTLSQRGLYRELLDYCYMEGSLPEDRKILLSIAGATAEAEIEHCQSTGMELSEHSLRTARARLGHDLSTVLALFEHRPSTGRYHHQKVDEVIPKLLSYHEQKKHAGAKSGQARRERALNVRSDKLGTEREPSPSPAPTPSPEPSPSMPIPSQSEYPLTIAEIRKHDAAVDDIFVLRLVQESMQACLSSPKFPADKLGSITDKVMAEVCRESYASGPPGHRTGLLLRRVPNILISWGIEATNGQVR
jgi:uncharacterized protein YdaU (DUF1376 family)